MKFSHIYFDIVVIEVSEINWSLNVQGILNYIPHIQLDHFEPTKKDTRTGQQVLYNSDVEFVNKLDSLKNNQYAINDKESEIINLRDYITTHELLLEHMDHLYMDLAKLYEKYNQINTTSSSSSGQPQWTGIRIIPAKHKQQIVSWAENYKTYLVIKLADRAYSTNEKELLNARYQNDVGGLLKEVLGSPAWQQEINRIKHQVRGEGIIIYKQHYSHLLELIKLIGKAPHSSARSKYTLELNNFIHLFADLYFTKTFPINNTCFNHIKCYIEKINQFKGTRIQLI